MYVMKILIDKYARGKNKLYACFVDLRKAFDSIWRNGLFYKLMCSGVNGDFYKIVKSMNSNVRSAVKTTQGLTPFFTSTEGVRQSDTLSPLLFNLYVNDVPKILDPTHGVTIGWSNNRS